MSLQTPRVLPAHLHAFHPSNTTGARSTNTVRLLGTVTALRGETATIACGNNGEATIILKPDSHLQMGKLVEIVGKVADYEGVGSFPPLPPSFLHPAGAPGFPMMGSELGTGCGIHG